MEFQSSLQIVVLIVNLIGQFLHIFHKVLEYHLGKNQFVIDFAQLFTNFPQLEKINFQNNPTKAINLNNLTSEQLAKLINSIKEQKIRIDSFKGTILTDLLAYVNELVSNGNTHHTTTSHYLQTLTSSSVKNDNPQPKNDNLLLIGSLVIFGVSVLGIGYLLGKKAKKSLNYE